MDNLGFHFLRRRSDGGSWRKMWAILRSNYTKSSSRIIERSKIEKHLPCLQSNTTFAEVWGTSTGARVGGVCAGWEKQLKWSGATSEKRALKNSLKWNESSQKELLKWSHFTSPLPPPFSVSPPLETELKQQSLRISAVPQTKRIPSDHRQRSMGARSSIRGVATRQWNALAPRSCP